MCRQIRQTRGAVITSNQSTLTRFRHRAQQSLETVVIKGFRTLCGVTAGLILAFAAGQASADGYRGRGAKVYEQPFTWSGFYFGGHAGLATGDTQGTPGLGVGPPPGLLSTDYHLDGAL